MREFASVRTNILLTPSEHRLWTDRARSRGVSLAEFIRRSVGQAEIGPSADELAELAALASELGVANDRMNAAVDSTLAQLSHSARRERDEEMRTRVASELAGRPVEIDPAILDFAPDEQLLGYSRWHP